MAKGIRFYEAGGPEVMKWESLEVGAPGAGAVRVRHAAVGLNLYACAMKRPASVSRKIITSPWKSCGVPSQM